MRYAMDMNTRKMAKSVKPGTGRTKNYATDMKKTAKIVKPGTGRVSGGGTALRPGSQWGGLASSKGTAKPRISHPEWGKSDRSWSSPGSALRGSGIGGAVKKAANVKKAAFMKKAAKMGKRS